MNHRCPLCDKPVKASSTEWFPFCSDRCKLVDLGVWLDAEYRITCEVQPEQLNSALFERRQNGR